MCYSVLIWRLISLTLWNDVWSQSFDINQCITFWLIKILIKWHLHSTNFHKLTFTYDECEFCPALSHHYLFYIKCDIKLYPLTELCYQISCVFLAGVNSCCLVWTGNYSHFLSQTAVWCMLAVNFSNCTSSDRKFTHYYLSFLYCREMIGSVCSLSEMTFYP